MEISKNELDKEYNYIGFSLTRISITQKQWRMTSQHLETAARH